MIALDARHWHWLGRWASSFLLLPFAVVFALEGGGFGLGEALWAVFHAACLIAHEAGHFFFRFFGRFLMIAGGTILQLALPALLVFQGAYWNNKLGTQLALLWLGQGFVNVSIYAADAQARALPLIGNLGPESHDWGNMLTMLGWLEYTPLIAGGFYACALVCWAVMLAVPYRIN